MFRPFLVASSNDIFARIFIFLPTVVVPSPGERANRASVRNEFTSRPRGDPRGTTNGRKARADSWFSTQGVPVVFFLCYGALDTNIGLDWNGWGLLRRRGVLARGCTTRDEGALGRSAFSAASSPGDDRNYWRNTAVLFLSCVRDHLMYVRCLIGWGLLRRPVVPPKINVACSIASARIYSWSNMMHNWNGINILLKYANKRVYTSLITPVYELDHRIYIAMCIDLIIV